MSCLPLVTALTLLTLCAPVAAQPSIILTFDDLPRHGPWPEGVTPASVSRDMLFALKVARVRYAYGFINAEPAAQDPALAQILKDWTAAGFSLRNHGWSHRGLDDLDTPAFQQELLRNEAFVPPDTPKVFRFPYLDNGRDPAKRDAARQVLAQQGYAIAPDDIGAPDWAYNQAWVRCLAGRDSASAARLETGFLVQLKDSADRARAASAKHYGRDIPYVLLLHSSAFNAHMLPRVLEMLRGEGFVDAPLDMALADPANAASANPALPFASASLFTRTGERDAPAPFPLDSFCATF